MCFDIKKNTINKKSNSQRRTKRMIRSSFIAYFAAGCFFVFSVMLPWSRLSHIFVVMAIILFASGAVLSGIANLMNLLSDARHQYPSVDQETLSQLEKQLEICYHSNDKNDHEILSD